MGRVLGLLGFLAPDRVLLRSAGSRRVLSAPSFAKKIEEGSRYEPTASITRPWGAPGSCPMPPRYSGGGVSSGSPPLPKLSPSPGISGGSTANAPAASGGSSPALKFSGRDGSGRRWVPSVWGGPPGTSGWLLLLWAVTLSFFSNFLPQRSQENW